MTLASAVTCYVAVKRSLGAVFGSEAQTLAAFVRAVGDIPVSTITPEMCTTFCRGQGPLTPVEAGRHHGGRWKTCDQSSFFVVPFISGRRVVGRRYVLGPHVTNTVARHEEVADAVDRKGCRPMVAIAEAVGTAPSTVRSRPLHRAPG